MLQIWEENILNGWEKKKISDDEIRIMKEMLSVWIAE